MAMFSVLFDIAAKTASFESSMTRIERKFTNLEGFAKKAGATIGLAFGGGILLRSIEQNIAKQIEFGDALNKAAIKSGIQVDALSELAYAAKQSDIDLESLSAGLKKMQVAISTNAPIIKALGVNLSALKELTPDQQLEAFAQAVSQLKDPADRARAAVELFGRSGTDMLPLFEGGAKGIEEFRKAARDMGLTLNQEGATALAAADDAAKTLNASFEGLWRTITVKTAPTISGIFDLLRRAVSGSTTQDKIGDLQRELAALAEHGETSGQRVAGLRTELASLQRQVAVPGPKLDGVVGDTTALAAKGKSIDAMASAMDRLRRISVELSTAEGAINPWWTTNTQISDSLANAATEIQSAMSGVMADTNALLDTELQRSMDNYTRTKDEVQVETKATFDDLSAYAEEAAKASQQALADFLFDPFKEGLSGMLTGFLNVIRRMVAEIAAKQILQSSGLQAGLTSFIGGMFGGARASGGPVSSGSSYLVGERGPELFTPGSSGAITPNHALSGASVQITQNNDFRGATSDVMQNLPAILSAQADQIKRDVIEGIRRGKYVIA